MPHPLPAAISEVRCRTALSSTRLPELAWSLNPYRGCGVACVYCYAPVLVHWPAGVPWGGTVSAKVNITSVLAAEVRRKKRGAVGIGTVTDAYQPLERQMELTRRCIEVLARRRWPLSVQTKSALIARDADILRMTESDVGFSFSSGDEEARRRFEPYGSSIGARLATMEKLSGAGIGTWAFLGPLLPGIGDGVGALEEIVAKIKRAGAARLYWDRLRLHPDASGASPVMAALTPVLRARYPGLVPLYRRLFGGDGTAAAEYYGSIEARLSRAAAEYGLPLTRFGW